MTISGEVGNGAAVLRFDRPVKLASVTNQTVHVNRGGTVLSGSLTPVDPALTAGALNCATTFYFVPDGGWTLKDGDTLSVSVDGVITYAGTSSKGTASATIVDPMPFTDVPANQYYYDAVLWAINHDPQITNGTNAAGTLFSPDATCTRAQIVTFLWRAMGQPKPASMENPFTDVKKGSYYYDAVLWAVENGITNGTNAAGTTFSPDQSCTRGQVVTFLYRAEKKPVVNNTTNPFTDVKEDSYYSDAVLWAVENKITNGTNAAGTTFSPDVTCTRGQIVTFLYRDMG